MSQQINLREANQHLSQYIEAVSHGEEVIITRRGSPVAKLIPFTAKTALSDRQKQLWDSFMSAMRKGYNLGGEKFNREQAHTRSEDID